MEMRQPSATAQREGEEKKISETEKFFFCVVEAAFDGFSFQCFELRMAEFFDQFSHAV